MLPTSQNGESGLAKIMAQLGAEKKKAVVALGLIGVMMFMWIKVLSGQEPDSARGALVPEQTNGVEIERKTKISFVELPAVKGRNDVLRKDFFKVKNWQGFFGDETYSGNGEVDVVVGDGSKEYVRQVKENLKLEAILFGNEPQVFLNGQLLSVGDWLTVKDKSKNFECEVVRITENAVFVRSRDAEIKIKLSQPDDKVEY